MPPTRSQRSGATLDELRAAVRAEFGPAARIVAAERVTTPGIGGLFRKEYVEATIEVPTPGDPPTARVAIADGTAVRAGIAALLADAEEAEARIAGIDGTAAARSDAFASVLDGFVADGITAAPDRPTRPEPGGPDGGPAPRLPSAERDRPGGATDFTDPSSRVRVAGPVLPVPPVRSADGDLVLLAGRPGDVDAAAGLFATRHALRATAAADRRSGILARAEGVRDGRALLAVAGWDDVGVLEGLAPDQTWLVVDVGRKPEDAAAMLGAVTAIVPVTGVVAIGLEETATPETVHLLGLPVVSLG
uniref:Uncharacterized protein n=1 Tax=Neobacillus citreus TaxID=2833578 RepID=A0A942SZZ2_9BACI